MMLPLCDQDFATQLYENQQVTRAIAEACSQWTQDWATCPAKVKRAEPGEHSVTLLFLWEQSVTLIFIL